MVSFVKILSRTPFALWAKSASTSLDQLAHHQAVSDNLVFLKNWRKHPAKMGAILPSGSALCQAITCEITAAQAPILELGCGTGVFTQKLIDLGILSQDLILVEDNPLFANSLHLKFPRAQVLCVDACKLHRMPVSLDNKIGAAICGLPLRNMSARQQLRILKGVFALLRENGALYLFSYGWACPTPLHLLNSLSLQAQVLNTVFLNVPPAKVWKITRLKDDAPESQLLNDSRH